MKRSLCIALIVLMLCPLLLQTENAAEAELTPVAAPDMTTVSAEVLNHGLNSKQANHEALQIEDEGTSGQFSDRAASRAAQNNLLTPAPLMHGLASSAEGFSLNLPCVAYEYGRSDQSYAVMIYKGTNLNKDPVAASIGNFSTSKGMRAVSVIWRYKPGVAVGAYTVVTCTVTGSGNNYQVVKDTAYAETIYIVPSFQNKYELKSVWFEDAETGKRVNSLKLGVGDTRVLMVHTEPEINFGDHYNLEMSGQGLMQVDNYYGLYVITAKDQCGWADFISNNIYSFDCCIKNVEVCWDATGHQNVQTTHLRNAERDVDGADLQYCPRCGAAHIVYADKLETVFNNFKDLNKNAWYYEAVKAAVYAGLFSGVSTAKFDPNGVMTRAMLVSVLWSYAGKPESGESAFTDVPAGQWFTKAVSWAAENKIVSGTGEGRFSPNGVVTREQVAVILQRFAAFMGEEIRESEDTAEDELLAEDARLNGFEDADRVSAWALDAVKWAVSEGLISGVKSKELLYLQPQGSASRAQVAAILTSFLKRYQAPEPPVDELDLTGAEAHDTNLGSEWAFYPDGTLVMKTSAQRYWSGRLTEAPWADYNDRVTTVKVLNTVTAVGNGCFHDMPNLERVELPDSVTEIGQYAFAGCTALREITLPEKLRILDNGAFSDCVKLEHIDLPQTLQNIGAYCFKNCTSLKKIEIPDAVVKRKAIASGDRSTVEDYAFSGCAALESVRLPAGMLELPQGLFQNCNSLRQLELPIGIQIIRADVFSGCEIEQIYVQLSVSTIEDNAFRGVTGLKEVWVFNPLAKCVTGHYSSGNIPIYNDIFGDPKTVTVYSWAESNVEQTAKKCGYAFIALDDLPE